MNKTYLTLLPGLLFLSACGSQSSDKPVNPVADSAAVLATDSLQVTETVNKPQAEEIVIGKVIELLTNDEHFKNDDFFPAEGMDDLKRAAKGEHKTNEYVYDIPVSEEQDEHGCSGYINVGAFKRTDGKFLVLVFNNGGCDGVATASYLSYVFDGEHLTKSDFELPNPKLSDFMDGLTYFGMRPEDVSDIKENDGIREFGRKLFFVENRQLYISPDLFGNFGIQDDILLRKYNFVNDKFTVSADSKLYFVRGNHVGGLVLGNTYNGEAVEGYVVDKLNATDFMLKKNGTDCVRVVTNEGKITEVVVLGGDYAHYEYKDVYVGANLNKLNEKLKIVSSLERENGNIVVRHGYEDLGFFWLEFAEKDLVGSRKKYEDQYEDLVFADDAKLKSFSIKLNTDK